MNLILDTHVFLWVISGDIRLPKTFHDSIRNPDNAVFLSVASNWEIIIKFSLEKLPLPESPDQFITAQRRIHKIQSLPISESSLSHLITLPKIHSDPFDRLLISQALSHNLTIITVDTAIMKYNVPVFK